MVAEFRETPITVCLTFERDMCEANSCQPRRLVRVPSSRQGLTHRLSFNHQSPDQPLAPGGDKAPLLGVMLDPLLLVGAFIPLRGGRKGAVG